jgi:hypothetical protein
MKADKPVAALGQSPELSPSAELPQESKVTLELSIAEDKSRETIFSMPIIVLEKPSLTDRKSGARPTPSPSELGSVLTRAVSNPAVPLSELKTKAQSTTSTLPPVMESSVKAQVPIQASIANPDAGLTSVTGKPEELKKTEAGTQTEIAKVRHRSSSALVGYGLTGVGGLSLVTSVAFTSTVLGFIGLGLTFWGALLLFIRPRYYVRTDVMDSTALSSLKTIDRVITGLGYEEKGIYIPVSNPEKAVVFVPSEPMKEIPKPEQIEKETFVKDPEGISIVPPGMALANLFEKELGVKFSEWTLEKMTDRLPKLLIEDLEMVQDCAIKIEGDQVSFRFVESVFSDFCGQLKGTTKVCSSLGCPMCSAMACILAQVTHRPVRFDQDKYTVDGTTVESSYRLLKG